MKSYIDSFTTYQRLKTLPVKVGNIIIGDYHPLVLQTMVNTNTMDTIATVEQCIRCIEAGAEMIRITAPSKKEAENLFHIKKLLRERGFATPLVADIHFTPNAADIAAEIVEKVRINPGNYLDKKNFELKSYSDDSYNDEVKKIEEKFIHFLSICEKYNTAIRIGANHGSLSDRIMSRYGDTPMGMVESAMEFLRIGRKVHFHNIVLSMKSSNPLVMVQAYRLLVQSMKTEFGECYPLHLGVTEAGDGEDGRIKSAIGIGTLLEDGIGDTIRVSLTENPEFEIPVCYNLATRYKKEFTHQIDEVKPLPYNPLCYNRQDTLKVEKVGNFQPPVVVAELSQKKEITIKEIEEVGYIFKDNKWQSLDMAADFIMVEELPKIGLPQSLKCIIPIEKISPPYTNDILPLYTSATYVKNVDFPHVVKIDISEKISLEKVKLSSNAILLFCVDAKNNLQVARAWFMLCRNLGIHNPVIIQLISNEDNKEKQLLNQSIVLGGLILDGFGDGICVHSLDKKLSLQEETNIAFGILQATRIRITKTEYISCPSCGRTLFDLMDTTAKIRQATKHLKGVKIAIMGCIVNGPGEMADADFGYVGSGVGTINLYKGKDIVKKNIPEHIAVEELITLLKENKVWKEK